MTLKSEPIEVRKPVRYTNSLMTWDKIENTGEILINGVQPRVLVTRLGPVLQVVPLFADYPKCVECGMLVASGRDTLARLTSGEVAGICHICDPTGRPQWRTRYNERRYELD